MANYLGAKLPPLVNGRDADKGDCWQNLALTKSYRWQSVTMAKSSVAICLVSWQIVHESSIRVPDTSIDFTSVLPLSLSLTFPSNSHPSADKSLSTQTSRILHIAFSTLVLIPSHHFTFSPYTLHHDPSSLLTSLLCCVVGKMCMCSFRPTGSSSYQNYGTVCGDDSYTLQTNSVSGQFYKWWKNCYTFPIPI